MRYLQAARALGDALIVGAQRRRIGAAQQGAGAADHAASASAPRCWRRSTCVDAVVIFDEDTPATIIGALQPDVLVKGADWAADQIVGRDTVEARGGRVVRVPVEEGYSTTRSSRRCARRIAGQLVLDGRFDLRHDARRMIVMLCSLRACASAFANTSSRPSDDHRVAVRHDIGALRPSACDTSGAHDRRCERCLRQRDARSGSVGSTRVVNGDSARSRSRRGTMRVPALPNRAMSLVHLQFADAPRAAQDGRRPARDGCARRAGQRPDAAGEGAVRGCRRRARTASCSSCRPTPTSSA